MARSELNQDMILMLSNDTQALIYLKLSHATDFRRGDYAPD